MRRSRIAGVREATSNTSVHAIYRFNPTALRAALEDLSPRRRTTFSLLCATRLAPAFQHRTVTRETFGSCHAELWKHILTGPTAVPIPQALHTSVEALVPDEEGEAPHAEDAIAALEFACRCAISGNPEEAAWSAERAYNTLDM
jgi:hypothetical protein